MLRFTNYLIEREISNMADDLDFEFLRKAEKVTSFNIATKDFESLKYKKEIQHLINKHFFPNFDLSKTLNSVDMNKLNKLIFDLKSEDARMFDKLHNYTLKGVGPGEATLFFLVNNAHLGGGSSAGVDLVVGSSKYEVKAVSVSRDGYAYDFKLGGTVQLSDIMSGVADLAKEYNLSTSRTEVKPTSINKLREISPEFRALEKKYAERSYEYFKGHDVIFINNSKTKKRGNIEAIKQVKKEDTIMYHMTSGTIKPKVKL